MQAEYLGLQLAPFSCRAATKEGAEDAANYLPANLAADGASRAFTHRIEQTSRFRLP